MSTHIRRSAITVLTWFVLIHAVLFMTFWLTNSLFYTSVNDYLTDMLNSPADYVSIFLMISGVLGVWSCIRLLLSRTGRRHRLWAVTTWLYGILAVLYLVFFYGSFRLLLSKSPVQQVRIGQMLLYFRVVLDPVILLGAALAGGLWLRKRLLTQPATGLRAHIGSVVSVGVLYAALWALLLVFPPSSVYQGALPDKPLIIAHRGASMLAPENTVAAFQRAAALRTYGVEADIAISRDGALYLMHDDDLKRTTNVAQVFPGREQDRPETFTLAEVQQLNAGEWFVQSDPFKAVARKVISTADAADYGRQAVPTLAQTLDIVRQNKLTMIFDLKPLPAGEAHALQLFDLSFQQIHGAGIDSQIWWLAERDQIARIRTEAPGMKLAYGADWQKPPEASALVADGYQIVNVEYGIPVSSIRQYHAAGLWVNLYTIDEPWQFSRLWLLGVDSTTTSNAQAMLAMARPALAMPYSTYLWLWLALGFGGVGLMALFTRRALVAEKAG